MNADVGEEMRLNNFQLATRFSTVAIIASLFAGCATPAAIREFPVTPRSVNAQQRYASMSPVEQYLIADRQAEIALARSAAPPAISSDATILVMTGRGYEKAVEGKNGFVCMVDRAWQAPFVDPEFWNPRVRAPVCLNPAAARSVLPIELNRTELALAGLSKDEIMARITTAISRKELGPPEAGAMSYMMSRDQYLNDEDPRFQPHLMFYVPNTFKGQDWGANVPKSPVMVGPEALPNGEREPVIVFLVPVGNWSDGTASSHGHHANTQH
jgi:hypothetical protein